MYGRDETGPVTCGTVQPLVTTIADRVPAIRSDVPYDGPNADPSDPVNLDTCLRAVAARRENLGGDGHRRTFTRSTQPNARKAKGGAPSGRWNFAATVVVAGARGLSRRERSHDRRQRFQADHPRPSGQDGRVLPNSPADTRTQAWAVLSSCE